MRWIPFTTRWYLLLALGGRKFVLLVWEHFLNSLEASLVGMKMYIPANLCSLGYRDPQYGIPFGSAVRCQVCRSSVSTPSPIFSFPVTLGKINPTTSYSISYSILSNTSCKRL